jgi:hypothetical protein
VRAVATYLVAAHYLPLHRAAAVLTDLCAAPVSPGSVASWVQRGAAGLDPFWPDVAVLAAAAAVVGALGLLLPAGRVWPPAERAWNAMAATCTPGTAPV